MTLYSTLSSPPSSTSSSFDDNGDGVVGYCSPHHLQAQRLNNTAATYIDNGQQNHEKVITILAKALRICERERELEHEHAYDVCSCHYCSIDGCIVLSPEDDDNDDDCNDNDINEHNNDGTHIYQNPIYVLEGHNMSSTLIHIIVFNLAIAHHLRFIEANNNENEIKNENESIIINEALQFYEFACECNLSNTRSIYFDTIICNNLCHIYRYQEQKEEEQHQQQHAKQQQEKQRPITNVEDDENDSDDSIGSLDMPHLIEFDYYSQEEEQDKYMHAINHRVRC